MGRAALGRGEGLAEPVDEDRAVCEPRKRVGHGEDANFVSGFFSLRYISQEPFDLEQPPGGVADRRVAALEPIIGTVLRTHTKFVLGGLAPLRRHLRQ